ncbi:hypothetical protein [Porphyromonas macacae]|uniref:Undecaprenyl-phosphate alpha-N-acetylglucosaminyl 1-phosphate transferase n=1 Tax=Porphyromonas macacae TaxID=28115 RepID=A0A379DJ13_9PORP|nr:hypothetical protein [Porphyromonas macacae]SUB77987.1 Undecaprenyl-phosphate alpha-N-acetylglucosaminyl 1-phosphate transferase [Porphyromonas macacae]
MEFLFSLEAMYVYAFVISLLLGSIIIPKILIISTKRNLCDIPNVRKIHHSFVSRLGGFSFASSVSIASLLTICLALSFYNQYIIERFEIFSLQLYVLLCGVFLLFLVGLYDDLVGATYKHKLIFQIGASSLPPLFGIYIDNFHGILGVFTIPAWLGVLLTIFIMVVIINSINFIDGIDGLASGLTFCSMLVMLSLSIWLENYILAIVAAATLGVIVPFFIYNVFGGYNGFRKKIFMGDSGSLTLGYLSGFFVVALAADENFIDKDCSSAFIISFTSIILPVFDLIHVVFLRLSSKHSPFHPDMNHIHHRLIKAGFSMHLSLLIIIVMSCLFIFLGIYLAPYLNINAIFLIYVVIWLVFNLIIKKMNNYKKIKEASIDIL